MNLILSIWRSSLGKKYMMAISGAGVFLFVIGHMIGNLQFFLGPEAINRYGHFLQSNLELLWPVRLGLLALVALHIISSLRLWLENNEARPIQYGHEEPPVAASLASRTMLFGGVTVAAFIIYHLLHYTVCAPAINFAHTDFAALKEPASGQHDIYAMMVLGFGVWYVSLFYALGVGFLCLHLSHGASAMFQSVGWRNHTYTPLLDQAAKVVAIILCVGYLSIPAAVLCGVGQDHVNGLGKATAALSQEAAK